MLLAIRIGGIGVDEAQELSSGHGGDAAFDHRRACLFDARRVAGNEDARLGSGACLIAYWDATATLDHVAADHIEQLRLR